jgi:hypothetical protein
VTSSPFERAGAALQEAVYQQWRDWTSYLRAHLTLLDARAAERQVAFERDETLAARTRQAHAVLDGLPHARRALFDELYEARRQELHATSASASDGMANDPDRVERAALDALLHEATGGDDPAGWGVVPIREGSTITWYEVNVAALQAAPTAATYALGAADEGQMRTRYALAGLLIGGGVLFLLVWFLWPRGQIALTPAALSAATVNGAPLAPWPIVGLLIEAPGTAPTTLAVGTSATGEHDAIWDAEHLVPLRLCLPADVLSSATTVTLLSGDGHPDRVYTIAPDAPPRPGLLLRPCSGDAPPRAATLGQILTPPDAAPGETHTLADGETATLAALTLSGPGDDPTLPTGQARLVVQAEAQFTDWAAYAPTLLLANGQALLPAEAPVITTGMTTLHYLIPLPAADTPVVWSLTPPGTQRPSRWRTTISVPPDRATVVRETIRLSSVALDLRASTLTLTVTVQNARNQPFVFTPDDIRLTRGTATEPLPLTLPEPAALNAPLAPSATRTLVLSAALPSALTDPLILTVGAQRVRLTLDR